MSTGSHPEPEQNAGGERKQRRSRSRQPGSIQAYDIDQGKRWRFQIYVLKDPEYPEMGSRRLTRSGFTSTDEANDALQEALKQRKQNEKFGNKVPTVGAYADEWAAGLKLAASTVAGYKKIIRNHIRPQLSAIRLDKLTATSKTTVATISTARASPSPPTRCTRCMSCSVRSSTPRSTTGT